MSLATLRAARAEAFDKFNVVATKTAAEWNEEKDQPVYNELKKTVETIDAQIAREEERLSLEAKSARPVPGQEPVIKAAAQAKNDPWEKDKGLVFGGIIKMIAAGGGNIYTARQAATEIYGDRHEVTKALLAGSGPAGGLLIADDFMADIIPLLQAQSQVRAAGPRTLPMPRGTMRMPRQSSAATASYGSETARLAASQPAFENIVATYHKLTAFVPISNDLMRYADAQIDGFVRDDMVRQIGLREDMAFILGDGSADSPRGFLSFANAWVAKNGGTVGVWSTTANSTLAVNGADPAGSTGGNFITANATFTLATVNDELAGAVNRLDTANVPDMKRVWFMHPRTYNYLYNVQNSLGLYVFRDELKLGMLHSYPIRKTTQIGVNYWDASGTNKDLSFVFLVEMTEDMLFDSMQLELAVSREASYVDSLGNTISAFQEDQTLIRAIAEHDHQVRHDQAIAVIQGVRWRPAIA
jgi:HK97 family phage major capsid protein